MRITALIVAGGKGLRMGAGQPKQYIELNGLPILAHTLSVFDRCQIVTDICLVVPSSDIDFCRERIVKPVAPSKPVLLTQGGTERQHSVYNGIKSIDLDHDDIVLVHDGVRPFVTDLMIRECVEAAQKHGAAVLAVPVSDTLKVSDGSGTICKTIDREMIWAAQTPQTFRYSIIREAHDVAVQEKIIGTDDAFLVERLGKKVVIVQGSKNNIKITSPEDMVVASFMSEKNSAL